MFANFEINIADNGYIVTDEEGITRVYTCAEPSQEMMQHLLAKLIYELDNGDAVRYKVSIAMKQR